MQENEIKITASGTHLLTEKEKELVNKLLNEYALRVYRQLKNQISLEFNIKEYEKTGKGKIEKDVKKAKKYSVHVRVFSTKNFEADYADWDLARAIHKVMNKLLNEIEHSYHVLSQHTEVRRPQQVRKRGR